MKERYFEWKLKIPKKDKLRAKKRDAIKMAIELYYPDTVLEQIISAGTEIIISNALCNARYRM